MSEYIVIEAGSAAMIQDRINQQVTNYELVSFTVVPVPFAGGSKATYVAVMRRRASPDVTAMASP